MYINQVSTLTLQRLRHLPLDAKLTQPLDQQEQSVTDDRVPYKDLHTTNSEFNQKAKNISSVGEVCAIRSTSWETVTKSA